MGWLWTLVLHAGLGASAYVAARDGLRQRAGWPRVLGAAVLAWAWLSIGMEVLGSFGLLQRGALLGWVVLGAVAAAGCRAIRGAGPAEVSEGGGNGRLDRGWGWEGVAALGLVIWAALTLGLPSLFLPVKVVSDGPIYHLYFAARWWKSGRLELIATTFGENAATYFPAVGDLWFTWLMVAWGGDRLAKVGQAPFLLLAGQTAYAMARRLGAGRSSALLATAWFVTSTPLFLFSFEPNVDTLVVAGYLLSAYFFGRYALGDDGLPALLLGALAAGCTLGTKAICIVFVPPLLVLVALAVVRREPTLRGKVVGLLTVGLGPMLVAGFWYAQNAWLTGNPLYPLHLAAFGRVWLAGWYGPEVMRFSPYYLPREDWRSLVDILLKVLDPRLTPAWLLSLAGAWAWGRRGDSRVDRMVWAAAALAVANVALYWLLVPYRTQQRFMVHALGTAVVPLALGLDRGRPLRVAALLLLVIHLLMPEAWPFAGPGAQPPWDLSPVIPNKGYGLIAWPRVSSLDDWTTARAVLFAVGSFVTAWAWGRPAALSSLRRTARASLISLGVLAPTCLLAYPWGVEPRLLFFPPFPEYVRGWLELDYRSGPAGARVAYAGNALPYYLLGVGLRNEVRYVNVDAHRDWLLHDYHREASRAKAYPVTWDRPRPGWDRTHPDYGSWLANLRAERIQLLVVNRANPAEGLHNLADREGFPIERVWADAHPETFVPLYGLAEKDPEFRLYGVR